MGDSDYRLHAGHLKFAGLTRTARVTAPRISRGDRRRLVAELATFQSLRHASESDLAAVVSRAVAFSFPANWPMVSEGSPAGSCYLITAGTAKLFQGRNEVGEVGRGEVIGELTVRVSGLRPVTVTTSTRVTGLRVSNDDLLELVDRRPSLQAALHGSAPVRTRRPQPAMSPLLFPASS